MDIDLQRLERALINFARRPLVRAFALSIALHISVFIIGEVGSRTGLWDISPFVISSLLKNKQLMIDKQQSHETDEQPLLFVEVLPEQSVDVAPKSAQYYSSQNSIAANPAAEVDTGKPRVDGTQDKVPKTVTANPQKKAEPLQPSISPEKNLDDSDQPQSVKETPAKGNSESTDVLERGQIESGKNPSVIVTQAVQKLQSRTRPRRVAEALQRNQALAGEAINQKNQGVKRLALKSSFDVKATPFGDYDAAFIAAVQQRWYDLIEQNGYWKGPTGKVVLTFKLMYDGRIVDLKVEETTVGELLALICQKAVLDPSPYPRWPLELRRLVKNDYREVQFTFYYN